MDDKQIEDVLKSEISDVKKKLQRAEELLENLPNTENPLAPVSVEKDPLVQKLQEEK